MSNVSGALPQVLGKCKLPDTVNTLKFQTLVAGKGHRANREWPLGTWHFVKNHIGLHTTA